MILDQKIDFLKPKIDEIRDQGYHPVDMHMHTQYSDSYTRIANLLKKAKKMGISIAITDHNEVRGAVDAIGMNPDIMVIPGMELTTFERAHLLFYFYSVKDLQDFYSKHVEKKKTKNPYNFTNCKIQDIVDKGRNYNAIISAAHPYSPSPMGIIKGVKRGYVPESVLAGLDAIEVICGSHTMNMNLKATKLALETGKPFHGGSDAHTLMEIGKVVTYAKADDTDSFLDSIRKKENFVVGKPTNTLMKLPAYATLSNRHLRYLKPTLEEKTTRTIKEGYAYHKPRVQAKVAEIRDRSKIRFSMMKGKIIRKSRNT